MILLFLILLLPLFLFLIKNSFSSHGNLPPGPNIFQNLANLSHLLRTPHIAHTKLSKIYGPVISFRAGAQLVVVASSPAAAMEILKTQNRSFSGRYLPASHSSVPGLHQASITASEDCNATWKFLRGLGHRFIFSPKAVNSAAGIRRVKVMEMVDFLRTQKNGKVVNIGHVMVATLINIMSSILASRNMFGHGAESESDQMTMDFIENLIDINSFTLTDLFPALKGLDIRRRSMARNLLQKTRTIWADIIKERKARHLPQADGSDPTNDFLDILRDNSFTDDRMSIFMTEMLFASTDVPSIAAIWMMSELIKNQEILHKLRDEIADQAITGGNITNEERLKDCRYLQACIKETLRLHNPGPFIAPRRTIESCKLNGYTIPKGSIVLVNTWAIQTDVDYWEDPMMFKPERFLESTIDFKGMDFQFLPFGSGLRMCPGLHVAMRALQLMVASLVHYFDWSLPDGLDPSELDMSSRFKSTLNKDKPLYLIPKPRGKWVSE